MAVSDREFIGDTAAGIVIFGLIILSFFIL